MDQLAPMFSGKNAPTGSPANGSNCNRTPTTNAPANASIGKRCSDIIRRSGSNRHVPMTCTIATTASKSAHVIQAAGRFEPSGIGAIRTNATTTSAIPLFKVRTDIGLRWITSSSATSTTSKSRSSSTSCLSSSARARAAFRRSS